MDTTNQPTPATVLISGNTYPVRALLFNLGGKWDKQAKGWQVPAERADEARAIVGGEHRPRPRADRYGSTLTRFSSGAEVITNRRGRCIDAPCCGCCT